MASKIVPTKSNLISKKKSLALAKLGYDLMDRKRNILIREMMLLIDEAASVQDEIDITYAQAYDALQFASITLGNLEELVATVPVDDGLQIQYRSVMGVEIPKVTLAQEEAKMYYGLINTNSQLDEAYLQFKKVKQLTAKLAEVESSVYRLANAIKTTQKRANALQNIVIPQFIKDIKIISQSLEEKERESFSRLKVIKNKKNHS